MNPEIILYPLFAMVALVFAVLLRLAYVRVCAVRQKRIDVECFKLMQEGHETPEVRKAVRNYINLHEGPVLFYVIVILTFMTQHVSDFAVIVAWIYVVARGLHSLIHVSFNNVAARFLAFALSQVCLAILWIRLALNLF